MDDEDSEWELQRMDERSEEPPAESTLNTTYRPVDPGLAARIFRQMGRPYDKSAIDQQGSYYLNGWDDGEDEEDYGPVINKPDFTPQSGGNPNLLWGSDPRARAWRPDWGEGGNPLRTMEYRPARGGMPRARTMDFLLRRGDIGPTQLLLADTSGNGGENWSIDPYGMFPQYGDVASSNGLADFRISEEKDSRVLRNSGEAVVILMPEVTPMVGLMGICCYQVSSLPRVEKMRPKVIREELSCGRMKTLIGTMCSPR